MISQKDIDTLIARRSEIIKRQLQAHTMGLGQHIYSQLAGMLEELDVEIYTAMEIVKANATKDEDSEGLII